MLNSQMALSGNADDASVLAHVLFQNAAYASRRWNYLAFTRHVLITSDQMQRLNSQVANLYGRAVAAGSIEAAVVLANSLDRTYLIGAPPALELLDHETMKGSAIAPLALARYFEGQAAHPDTYAGLPQSAKPVDDGKRYLHLAADRGNPFAMNDVANAYALQKAPQDEKIWRDRANAAFQHEAAAGDAGAAFAYGENLTLYAHDGDPLERRDRIVAAFRRAADLGAPRAIESLAIWFKPGDAAEDAELFRRSRASVDAGQTNNAVLLGSLYEGGRGTPRDPTAALRAYALGYQIDIGAPQSPLQAKLNGLEPDGPSIAQRLPTSPGYASAKATSARLHVPGAQRWGGNEVAGVVVRSDGKRAVIATAAFNLGCDSFSGSCATPDSVEIGPSQTKYTSVRIVRKADTSVENGVVLLTVAAPNAPSAGVAETIPARVMTLAYEGPTASMQGMLRQPTRSYWGLIVGTSPDRRVLQLVLPTEGATGSGIFDLETGKLVGMYTDPFSLEATGPTTLLRALREASTNAN
jgi:TPR repeat protein